MTRKIIDSSVVDLSNRIDFRGDARLWKYALKLSYDGTS
jgi:hypothetical protein